MNTSDANKLLAEDAHAANELEKRREQLPFLAVEYSQAALNRGQEPDVLGGPVWEIGQTSQIIRGKARKTILMIDEQGTLYQIYYVRRWLRGGDRKIRKRINALWCSSQLVDACYEALLK